jgi:hypothetical protein
LAILSVFEAHRLRLHVVPLPDQLHVEAIANRVSENFEVPPSNILD